MKFIYNVVFCFSLIFSSHVNAGLLDISEKEINQYIQTRLAKKVPLQDKVGIPHLFQLEYKLYDLATRIGQTSEKKVEIQGAVNGILNARGKRYNADIKLNFDTIPFYEPEKGAVYLKDVRLLNWAVTPEKYKDELAMFIPVLVDGLSAILNNTPVYTLDESKTKEALVKKFGKAIIVEKGQLRLETTIF